jgi:SPP1 family predicted phage head-tail adaptor
MKPEKLDRRVTIQRFALTRGPNNEPVETWSDLATVWASKADVSDGEKLRAAQVGSVLTTRFVCRWSSDIQDVNAKDRLRFDGKTFDVVGVKEIGRHEGIEITAARASDEVVG